MSVKAGIFNIGLVMADFAIQKKIAKFAVYFKP